MLITKRRSRGVHIPLNIQGQQVDTRNSMKYLGFQLDRGLTFDRHIKDRVAKSHIAIKTLYPLLNRRSKVTLDNKLLIFKSILRPILTYGCPVYCSMANCHYNKLQIAQNICLRLALGYDRYARIEDMHVQTETPRIKDYVLKTAENFYLRCLPDNVKDDIFSIYRGDGVRRKHGCLHAKLDIYRHRNIQ